jgi:DNA (cytosine-5)-methyltransferase 1
MTEALIEMRRRALNALGTWSEESARWPALAAPLAPARATAPRSRGRMAAVDLFAGWGGFTAGAWAAGVDVVWAANHWQLAVDVHAANHLGVEHVCQDLRQADWTSLPPYDLLLAAPACQGHSSASRSKRRPYHDAMRATAWAVVDCVEVTQPRAFVVENVPDFRAWNLYSIWLAALRRLGYAVSETIVRASYVGVPQRRDRLFVIGSRTGRPIRLAIPEVAEPAFGPCIDWSAPGWRSITEAQRDARARIEAARTRFSRSLVQHVTGHRGISLLEPIRTITAKDQWIVVDGARYRPLTMREIARGMGFPEHYTWPEGLPRWAVVRGFGNAVCPPVARTVITQIAEAL